LGWIVLEGLNRLNIEVVARGGEEVVVVDVDVVELSKDSEIISSTFVTGNIWLDEDEELGSNEVVVINELEVGGGEGDDGDTMLKTRKKTRSCSNKISIFFIFQTFQLFSNDFTEHGFDFIPKEFPIDSVKYQLHPLVKSQHVKR
jgi:hypothetical protein